MDSHQQLRERRSRLSPRRPGMSRFRKGDGSESAGRSWRSRVVRRVALVTGNDRDFPRIRRCVTCDYANHRVAYWSNAPIRHRLHVCRPFPEPDCRWDRAGG
jgi:hypothetical protein